MNAAFRCVLAALLAAALLSPAAAAAQDKSKERDLFNYVAQKTAGKDVKKIVFIADIDTHGGPGNHEFRAGAIYMARTLNERYPNAYAVVHPAGRWPKNLGIARPKGFPDYAWPTDIGHADCIIVLLNHAGKAAEDKTIADAVERGAGFMAIHYGVEVNKGKQGDQYLKWIGGYFEPAWSVNPHWTPKFDKFPEHETTRGVKPFSVKDEWYYHMRFVKDMKGVTPVLSALPDLKTIQGGGKTTSSHGGNPAVYEEVKAGNPQHVAWAYVRPDNGRGFGFTGYHNFDNLKDDGFRTLLLNACAWTAKLEVPSTGIQTPTPSAKQMEELYQDGLRMLKN